MEGKEYRMSRTETERGITEESRWMAKIRMVEVESTRVRRKERREEVEKKREKEPPPPPESG